MTTYRPTNYGRNGMSALEQSSFSQASAVGDYKFYSELNTTNQGYNAKVFPERQFAKEVMAKKDVKSSKLAALLEQVQDNMQGSRVRSSVNEIGPKATHSSIKNQPQVQATQYESKKYNKSIFNDTQERFETESQIYNRNSYQQGMNALQASNSTELSQGGSQGQAQPHGIRNNSLYKFLNQYLVEKVPKGDQSPSNETKTIKQIPSSENLLQNCQSTTSSNPTCDSYSQMPETSAPSKSTLRDKLAATMKSLSGSMQSGVAPASNKKNVVRKNWAVEKAHLLKYLNNDASDLSGNEPGLGKKVIENPRARFSQAEDDVIIQGYRTHGSNWNLIAKELPTRTVQMIRKRFNALKKKLPGLLQESNQSSDLNGTSSFDESSRAEEFEIYASASKKVCKGKGEEELPRELNLFDDFPVAEKEQDFLSPLFKGNDFLFESQNQDFANQFLSLEGNFLDGGVLQGANERKKSLELEFFGGNQPTMFNDNLSFFDLKFEDNAEKVNAAKDCWNDMIDFNQDIKENHSLTPIATKPDFKICFESTKPAKLPEPENFDRLHQLLNQIKSIEELFNTTRKEISKLQGKF